MAQEQAVSEKRTARDIATRVEKDAPRLSLQPRNFAELWDFAKMISDTEFVPLALRSKPGAVIAAIQYGNEVGLPPMTSLRWIAVIHGVPSIWGDGYWMLIRSHPLCEGVKELSPEEALAKGYGECQIKRKGDPEPTVRRFTKEMAEKAELWGGKGGDESKKQQSTWFKYPGRMLQLRARALCGRDAIPEATGPLYMREEAEDFEAIETTATEVKEEPLKIPQAVKEEGDGSNSHAGTATQEPALDPQQPVADDGKDSEGAGPTREKAESERPSENPSPALEAQPKKETPTQVKEDILDWLENRATPEEILANKNYLTIRMAKGSGLSQQDQLQIVKAWNAKRKEAAGKKDATTSV